MLDKIKSINITARIFCTFIAVFLFFVIQVVTLPACGSDVKKEATPGAESVSDDEWDIVAEINGKTISTGELLKQYNLYFIMSSFSRTYKEGSTVNSYLDQYITEQLLLNKAHEMGINATKNEGKNEIKKFFKLYRLTEETLLKWLNTKTLTMEDAAAYLKNRLILKRLAVKMSGLNDASDEEAEIYYRSNNEYYNRTAKIQASHILICHTGSQGCESKLSRDEARALADKIRKSVKPESFAELAKQYSYDSTGKSGGSLGVITQGSAVPSFEKAAFALNKGEISDVVETDYGYHIIYVTDRLEARAISFEEAREEIKHTLEEEKVNSELHKYSEEIRKEKEIKKHETSERKDFSGKIQPSSQNNKASLPVKTYSTFKPTGKDILKNTKGQPVIILFTRKGCHFCEWVEETYEETVKKYLENGLIEAHHYDYDTKDDLMTPGIETEIPQEFLKLFDYDNPQKGTPYFSFGGMYYRAGTGYFQQDDLYAEEMEMSQVIEDILR